MLENETKNKYNLSHYVRFYYISSEDVLYIWLFIEATYIILVYFPVQYNARGYFLSTKVVISVDNLFLFPFSKL